MMRAILIGLVIAIAGAAGFVAIDWMRASKASAPYGAPFALVDQKGAPITEAAFRGQPTAVFFGFTHCPEVCPTTLFELDGLLKELGPQGDKLAVYFVSIDPERDTPELLDSYITTVSTRIKGITGDPEKVAAMAKSFGIYWKKVPVDGGEYTMDHTASILLLDERGVFSGTIAYGEKHDFALAKLKRLSGIEG